MWRCEMRSFIGSSILVGCMFPKKRLRLEKSRKIRDKREQKTPTKTDKPAHKIDYPGRQGRRPGRRNGGFRACGR